MIVSKLFSRFFYSTVSIDFLIDKGFSLIEAIIADSASSTTGGLSYSFSSLFEF